MRHRAMLILLFAFAAAQSPAGAGSLTSGIASFRTIAVAAERATPVMVRRGGMAVRRGAMVGPRGGAAYRRGGAVVGPRGGVAVRGSAGVMRPGWHGGGVRRAAVVRPGWHGGGTRWRPGGAIAAGAAIGFVGAATAVAWAGTPPAPNMCWYYTDQTRT